MIRAEDLMFGDWVKTVCPKEESYQRVSDINSSGYPYIITAGSEEKWFLVEVEPIPLTSEILIKNGFENDFYEDVSVADYHSIRVEGYSLKGKVDGWDDFLITFCNGRVDVVTDFHGEYRGEIEYLHQFQHALKLCGINLEIKL